MNEYSDKNDKTLVELTLLGDDSAYEELVIRHQRAVMGTAYKETENTFSAEDASQDAFVSAWMNLASLRESDKFCSWVCAIAKNCARTLNAKYHSSIPSISFDLLEESDLSDEECEWRTVAEERADLHDAVEHLSEKIRETISLHYFEDKSVSEIAELLNIPEGTVKWRLSEGRKQLRKGYEVMEKSYDEKENLVSRVMRQVEALKLWRLKDDRTGFEEEYNTVLQSVGALEDSTEKSYMLADTLLLGLWWLPGKHNDEIVERIRKAAEDGHNDEVMQSVACIDHDKFSGDEKINYMREKQIPYYKEHDYPQTLAYVWFWLGYEYHCKKDYSEAKKCFEEVLTIVPASNVYYANAKSAIEGEQLMTETENKKDIINYSFNATGEIYKKVGNTLYFWEQPGFGCDIFTVSGSIFYNLGAFGSIMLDESMKVGDSKISSDGRSTLKYTDDSAICDTPSGHFENCSVFVFEGEHYGLTNVETYICPGIGIVRQTAVRDGNYSEWDLSDYIINGGSGLIPFRTGNSWKYCRTDSDNAMNIDRINKFDVIYDGEGTFAVSNIHFYTVNNYLDTWEGRTTEVRRSYYQAVNNENEILRDVSKAMKRCEELAETKRQKTHTRIANTVMKRIFDGDEGFNPGCTEKGRWNFFERNTITVHNGDITFQDNRYYSFEWKDTPITGAEGNKALYSFMLTILRDATGCLWSDKWVEGYSFDEKKDIYNYKVKNFCVTADETVQTPAGTFEKCRHVKFEYESWGYFAGRSEYWFAPDIGIVLFKHPYDDKCVTWHLTEYSGKGSGYFPVDDGLFRRYEPDCIGEGWHASVEFTFDEDETGTVMFKNALGTQDRTF